MIKSFSKYPCYWCGRRISNNGLASSAHFKACKVRLGKQPPPEDSMFSRHLKDAAASLRNDQIHP